MKIQLKSENMANQAHCFLLLLTLSSAALLATAHVALTFPPARMYDLDFLDNSRTPAPCGMPKGKNLILTPINFDGLRFHASAEAARQTANQDFSSRGTIRCAIDTFMFI